VADHRPFPPSPRRAQLARRAGIVAASPHVSAAAAWLAAIAAIGLTGHTAAAQLGTWLAAACDESPTALAPDRLAGATIAIGTPLLVAAALAALVAHVVQTRGVWIPRRRLPGAPILPDDATARLRATGFAIIAGVGIAAATLAWLWAAAPRLANVTAIANDRLPRTGAAFIVGFASTLAFALVAIGVLDAVARLARHASGLRMTAAEKREDERLAAADPRWRRARAAAARGDDVAEAVRGATLLVVGDRVAAAVVWDAVRRPVPVCVATGRGARAHQLLALARHHGVAIHRDTVLATALVGDADGSVAQVRWPRLAEIVAAVQGRRARP
jgi:flagellar biosynthesis protein FlhB